MVARDRSRLAAGLNVHRGMVTEPSVAQDLGYDYVEPMQAIYREN